MYRSAVKRMIVAASKVRNGRAQLCHDRAIATNLCRFYASATSETLCNQSPNYHQRHPHAPSGALNHSDPASPSSSDSTEGGVRRESQTSKGTRPRAEYQDEQARVLGASLRHVISLGWTEAAMIAGAREVGVSPSIVGSFSRKEAALVEFFMDECLQRLIDIIDSLEDFGSMLPSERITKLIKIRLELQAPYISKWPQALSIQAQPLNISTSFKQRAMLVDEIWHAAGDEATDVDWYAKRAALGAIYSATEVYMLTDSSTDFRDTWAFLDARVKDAFDLKKTLQEAKYLAEAVGAGMESSVQGFMRRVFRAEN